jgi:hypothetical protein
MKIGKVHISRGLTQINADKIKSLGSFLSVFICVVLKTPASILSRDGNGAGAPEKNLRMPLPRESGMPWL